ncbi:hypothetical protein Hypma_004471 [Hypsizygus marmoreus]|uniref:Uncharacterized protein n=1 Tax=Hypsizygus marmoreus TaxID=39966 RepID=A0A369JY15_HYPMA|nr:hypothetical protein Hypma_004471 [Hypsizygus marmoreus]
MGEVISFEHRTGIGQSQVALGFRARVHGRFLSFLRLHLGRLIPDTEGEFVFDLISDLAGAKQSPPSICCRSYMAVRWSVPTLL